MGECYKTYRYVMSQNIVSTNNVTVEAE